MNLSASSIKLRLKMTAFAGENCMKVDMIGNEVVTLAKFKMGVNLEEQRNKNTNSIFPEK